jgi:hypothetical protein
MIDDKKPPLAIAPLDQRRAAHDLVELRMALLDRRRQRRR